MKLVRARGSSRSRAGYRTYAIIEQFVSSLDREGSALQCLRWRKGAGEELAQPGCGCNRQVGVGDQTEPDLDARISAGIRSNMRFLHVSKRQTHSIQSSRAIVEVALLGHAGGKARSEQVRLESLVRTTGPLEQMGPDSVQAMVAGQPSVVL